MFLLVPQLFGRCLVIIKFAFSFGRSAKVGEVGKLEFALPILQQTIRVSCALKVFEVSNSEWV
jgi:hypothetical protein